MYVGIKQLLPHRIRLSDAIRYAGIAAVVTVLIVSLASELRPTASGDVPAAQIVVHEGDTLWQLAQTYGPPHADPRRTVSRILEANHLSDSLIHPGEIVSIPQS